MTFVNKSPKWIARVIEDTPGPGAYCISPSKQQNLPTSCFLSKTLREEDKRLSEDIVGPGTYNLAKNYNNQEHCQAVFRSKIQRFTTKEEKNAQDQNQNENRFIQLLKYGEHQKKIPGKLVSLNQRREFQKKIMPQVLPSIPSNQSSFGYRFDQNSKRLVQNQNPKIIFANVISTTKQDFYFQRTQSNIGKGVHFSIQKKLKRSSPQLKYQVTLPDPTKYQPELKMNQKKTKNKKEKGFFVSQKQRFQETASPRQILRLQKLKRQFKDYFTQQFELKDIQNLKIKQSTYESQTPLKKSNSSQFFLSKIDRFNQNKVDQREKRRQIEKIRIQEKTIQKSRKQPQNQKKKQPYDLGQPRLIQKGKQNLGPGFYELKNCQSHAVFLNHKQQRFRSQNCTYDMPGPGSYRTQIPKVKQKIKVSFSKYKCNINKENNRFSSMQSLYEQVGKQLNYETKAERQSTKKAKNSPEKQQKAYVIYKKDMNRIKQLVQ